MGNIRKIYFPPFLYMVIKVSGTISWFHTKGNIHKIYFLPLYMGVKVGGTISW